VLAAANRYAFAAKMEVAILVGCVELEELIVDEGEDVRDWSIGDETSCWVFWDCKRSIITWSLGIMLTLHLEVIARRAIISRFDPKEPGLCISSHYKHFLLASSCKSVSSESSS
jgi:hypothetical protein